MFRRLLRPDIDLQVLQRSSKKWVLWLQVLRQRPWKMEVLLGGGATRGPNLQATNNLGNIIVGAIPVELLYLLVRLGPNWQEEDHYLAGTTFQLLPSVCCLQGDLADPEESPKRPPREETTGAGFDPVRNILWGHTDLHHPHLLGVC